MIADYDSNADALRIDLVDGLDDLDHGEYVEGTSVIVNYLANELVCVEVLGARANRSQLAEAARLRDLDAQALEAAAAAALAAPDREVRLDLATPAKN